VAAAPRERTAARPDRSAGGMLMSKPSAAWRCQRFLSLGISPCPALDDQDGINGSRALVASAHDIVGELAPRFIN
jgi:hypothetical protein